MSDYIPTTEEVRADYVRDHTRNFDSYMVGRSLTSEQEHYGTRFDRWLAAHDAEKRAEWEAELGTEEPEWEHAWEADEEVRTMTKPRGPRILFDGMVYPPETIALFARGRRVRRRKAGPWVPVEQEGEGDAS